MTHPSSGLVIKASLTTYWQSQSKFSSLHQQRDGAPTKATWHPYGRYAMLTLPTYGYLYMHIHGTMATLKSTRRIYGIKTPQ